MTASGTRVAVLARQLGGEHRGDAEVVDATHHSEQVRPGWLFCCLRGAHHDGHRFAAAAVARGASALLVERWLELDVPQVRVGDSRRAAGPAAAIIHHHPSRALRVVGVTGTNGKTSTTHLLEACFGAQGWGTGLIGTISARIHGEERPGPHTTPEGPDLQRLLAEMRCRGVDAVAVEVSSHGLDLHRVDGTEFAVAVFTNLSAEHLDHHRTMRAYFAAKARLFTPELSRRAVVCVDDRWGRELAAGCRLPVDTVGTHPTASHRIRRVRVAADGTRFELDGPEGRTELYTRMLGLPAARNAACAYLAAVRVGVDAEAAAAGIAACPPVPGRLEAVDAGQPFTVLVDYAHTPAALRAALRTARRLAGANRVLVVVGCGGDRDRTKRPRMGAAAARLADLAVLTSDNPRSENPHRIIADMQQGVPEDAAVLVEVDRRRAIAAALDRARPGDVVLIAGKGHETVQIFADHTVPFDDRQVARELLAGGRR